MDRQLKPKYSRGQMEDGIKKIREELGWTKQELADYLGVSCRSIFRWESGNTKPSKLAMKQIIQLQNEIISGGLLPTTPLTAQGSKSGLINRILSVFP